MLSNPVILDSSCWVEFFLGSNDAKRYAHFVTEHTVIVPALIVFEVSRILLQNFSQESVLRAVTLIKQHNVLPLTDNVALDAAYFANNLNLSSADALIYASAIANNATLYTHDSDLGGLDRVEFIPKTQSNT